MTNVSSHVRPKIRKIAKEIAIKYIYGLVTNYGEGGLQNGKGGGGAREVLPLRKGGGGRATKSCGVVYML